MTIRTDTYAPDFLIKVNGAPQFRHGSTVDVISVSLTETFDRADSFRFSLRAHNPTPERFAGGGQLTWIDDALFDEGNRVDIELGYIGNRTLKLLGEISGVTPSFPESGAPTLEVRGNSLYSRLQRKHRRKPFANKTDAAIAREIAQELDLKPDVQDTTTEHAIVSPQDSTYETFLKGRAARINYEVSVKHDTLIFRRPQYLVSASPQLTLVWGESLRSFSPVVSTSGMATEVEVRMSGSSSGGEKQAASAIVPASRVPAVLGERSGLAIAQAAFGDARVLSTDQRVRNATEAGNVGQADLERRAINYITGRGSCIGNPQLVAQQVIELKGLGKRFSGRYYVTSTTHTIDAGGYRTDFEVKRDGR